MRRSILIGICFLLSACATEAGVHGVDLHGDDSSGSGSVTEHSDKPWNEVSACINDRLSEVYNPSGVHYQEMSARKTAEIWFDDGAVLLYDIHSRGIDVEVTGTNDGTDVHGKAVTSLFGNDPEKLRKAVRQCI